MSWNYRNTIAVGVLILLILQGCEPDACFHAAGNADSKEVYGPDFWSLKVESMMHVILVDDTSSFVRFEGGSKVLPYVEVQREGSTLILTHSNSCAFFQDYQKIKAYVHTKTVHEVHLLTDCKLESQGTLSQELFITAEGKVAEINIRQQAARLWFYNLNTTAGKYTFSGYVDRLDFMASYTGQFNLEGLQFREGLLDNASISDIYANPLENLHVKIRNKGNVYYRGTPEIVLDTLLGTGEVRRWE